MPKLLLIARDPLGFLGDQILRRIKTKQVPPDSSISIVWPTTHPDCMFEWWTSQILAGFNVRIVRENIRQENPYIVTCRFIINDCLFNVVYDPCDLSDEIDEACLDASDVYFKLQFREQGYHDRRILPGGYVASTPYITNYLSYLRRLTRFPKQHDVYGRFGLAYNRDQRVDAMARLSVSDVDYHEGGDVRLFTFFKKMARAKLALHIPGKGDFCYRLIESMAIGTCAIGPRPRNRLPMPLIDREHMVFCRDDLSDLVELCRYYSKHDEEREIIAKNARDYYDSYLTPTALARYQLRAIEDVRSNDANALKSRPNLQSLEKPSS